MYEVWQEDTITKYDPRIGDDGLFAQYINTFMKIKMEASGYHSQCATDQEKIITLHVYEHTKELLCVQMTFHSMQDVVQSLNFVSIISRGNLPIPQIVL